MKEKINGVNLGGWLVLEKWMTPNVFYNVQADDEYYLPYDLSKEAYETRIMMHRNEFITEGDFLKIAADGFNMVRIPVPYFIFGDRQPYIGCVEELDKAFNWAKAYGLKILIDLHTAPMSQNGFDNGGLSGVCRWAQLPEEVEFELSVLERLAERYGHHEALFGIEAINEPITQKMWNEMNPAERFPARDSEMARQNQPIEIDFLFNWYNEVYNRIKSLLAEDKYIVFHDAFELHSWKEFFANRNFENVILDTHQYLMIAEQNNTEQSVDGYKQYLSNMKKEIEEVAQYVEVIVGEWCLFNSYAVGLDTKGGLNPTQVEFSDNRRLDKETLKEVYQELWKASLEAWNVSSGHFYWTYKLNIDTINSPDWYGWDAWDASRCVAHQWIVND